MSRRRLLSDQLARHRGQSTGERRSAVVPDIDRGLAQLSRADKGLLAMAMRHARRTQHQPENEPVVPDNVRRAILPDAVHVAQQELEAAIVEASSRAVNHLHNFPPISLCRPALSFRYTTPELNHLVLGVEPRALGPLVAELLPFDIDGEVRGLTGLRIRSFHNHIELYLADHPAHARVLLAGVTRRDWKASIAYVNGYFQTGTLCHLLGFDDPYRLTPAEHDDLQLNDRVYGPVSLMSALLRRIAVLRDALWIRTWTAGCDSLQVEWPGDGPPQHDVAAQLTHPVTGLPGGATAICSGPGRFTRIVQPQARRCSRHPIEYPPELVFRRTTMPSPADDDEELRSTRTTTPSGWAAWLTAHGTTVDTLASNKPHP